MHALQISLMCVLFCGALTSSPCEPGYVMMRFDSSCVSCAPGYYDSGQGWCEPCDLDTFQPQEAQVECHPCPPNTKSYYGATECHTCPEGQTLMYTNECGTCPPGKFFEYGDCYSCYSGFFKAEAGLDPCLPCPRNGHSGEGAFECIECAEGEALMNDGSCGKCPPGKYYDPYVLTCMDCYAGSYTDSANVLRDCYSCGGNSFSSEGSSKCMECPAGEVFIASSQTCDKCEPGYFYDQYSLSCMECPYNQFSVYHSQRSCTYCMSGTFARRGSTTCFVCPRGQDYISEIDDCGECSPDEYYDSYTATCGNSYDYYGTPLPEPFEELRVSSEPVFELPMEFDDELQPRVTHDPLWEIDPESEYEH